MPHNLDKQQRVDDGDDDGSGKEKEPFGVALQRFATGDKYEDATEREHHADDELGGDALPVGYPHAERNEEGYGGDDHRGEAAADELHAGGFAEMVDEGLAEGQQQEPLEVATQECGQPLAGTFADGLKLAGESHGGQHDEGGYAKP